MQSVLADGRPSGHLAGAHGRLQQPQAQSQGCNFRKNLAIGLFGLTSCLEVISAAGGFRWSGETAWKQLFKTWCGSYIPSLLNTL
eukprot:5327680-Amphidinium_carterae.1